MPATLVFVHGIGAQDHEQNRARIVEQLNRIDAFHGYRYAAVQWDHLAPPDFDVSSALPRPPGAAPAPVPDAESTWANMADDLHSTARADAVAAVSAPSGTTTASPATAPATTATPASTSTTATPPGITGFFENVALSWLTDRLVDHRIGLTNGLTDLIRDLLFYLKRGTEIRALVRETLLEVDRTQPVVLFGHSLGGVACVDIMGDPRPTVKGIRVDLLVTAGSQAPWLYLMDSLELLRPGDPEAKAFDPWINFYDRRDFLSFLAGRVFEASPVPPTDFETVSNLPFPVSHGSYLGTPAIYEQIARRLRP